MQAQYKFCNVSSTKYRGSNERPSKRDDNFIMFFQAEPIALMFAKATAANEEYYKQLMDMTNSEIVIETTKKLNELRKQVYIQSKSYDDLIVLSKNKEALFECIPGYTAGTEQRPDTYGFRLWMAYRSPVYHPAVSIREMDLYCAPGTDIYATGNGNHCESRLETGLWKLC